jgi:hypothetical protein
MAGIYPLSFIICAHQRVPATILERLRGMLVVASARQPQLRLDTRITFAIAKVDPQPARDLGQFGSIVQRLGSIAIFQVAFEPINISVNAR